MPTFKVSAKGIACVGDTYLLRVNERNEYELLGGKLEHTDESLASRVRQEFLEESGVAVEPQAFREPWFYVFGERAVLIVPMECMVTQVPHTLFDQDGGRLEWVERERVGSLALPRSYLAPIRGERPHLERHEDTGRPYPDDQFEISLSIRHSDGQETLPVDEPCDFAERLAELGYPEAAFRTIRRSSCSSLQVVFDADDALAD